MFVRLHQRPACAGPRLVRAWASHKSFRPCDDEPPTGNDNGNRSSRIDGRTRRHASYAVSQDNRKQIEEHFGWDKTVGGLAPTMYRGIGWRRPALLPDDDRIESGADPHAGFRCWTIGETGGAWIPDPDAGPRADSAFC